MTLQVQNPHALNGAATQPLPLAWIAPITAQARVWNLDDYGDGPILAARIAAVPDSVSLFDCLFRESAQAIWVHAVLVPLCCAINQQAVSLPASNTATNGSRAVFEAAALVVRGSKQGTLCSVRRQAAGVLTQLWDPCKATPALAADPSLTQQVWYSVVWCGVMCAFGYVRLVNTKQCKTMIYAHMSHV